MIGRIFFLIFFLFLSASSWSAKIEIVFWHSMSGALGTALIQLLDGFNNSQSEYVIKPVYKGDYQESLVSFAASFRAKQPPALVQIFEVGKPSMLYPKGIITPVDTLLKAQHLELPTADFLMAVREYYSENGHLMAMPFNISLPVIFYNADALAKLGIHAQNFPKTWDDLENLARKLRAMGYPCAYTSAYPPWIFIESYAAIHGLSLVSGHQAVYNHPAIIRHIERLKRWQQTHYFEYGGRTSDAGMLFTSGRCAMFSQSSGSFRGLSAQAGFRVGVAAMPWDPQVSAIRYPNLPGGAAIWVVSGQSKAVEKGIGQFFKYLTNAKTQAHWLELTGYLPIGIEGSYQSIYTKAPNFLLQLAMQDLDGNKANSSQSLIMYNQIRSMNEEALESVFADMMAPAQALNEVVERANHWLLRQTPPEKEASHAS